MPDNNTELNNQNRNSKSGSTETFEPINAPELIDHLTLNCAEWPWLKCLLFPSNHPFVLEVYKSESRTQSSKVLLELLPFL